MFDISRKGRTAIEDYVAMLSRVHVHVLPRRRGRDDARHGATGIDWRVGASVRGGLLLTPAALHSFIRGWFNGAITVVVVQPSLVAPINMT